MRDFTMNELDIFYAGLAIALFVGGLAMVIFATTTTITIIGLVWIICGMVLSGIGIYEWQRRKKQ